MEEYRERIKTDGVNFRAMGILSLYIMPNTDGSIYISGGDDVQQLCEAGEEEFLEIMALVGSQSQLSLYS